MANLILYIDGTNTAYISANISYSMDSLAHQFNATLPPKTVQLNASVPIEFYLDKTLIFSGYLDLIDTNITSSSAAIKIAGRSLIADMIDSTRTYASKMKVTFAQLLTQVMQGYNTSEKTWQVIDHANKTEIIDNFAITVESPMQSLVQLAKQQNLILQETNQGIEIFSPAQLKNNNIKLEIGKNISQANITHNWSKRYYYYEVRGYPNQADAPIPKHLQTDTNIRQSRGRAWIADKLTDNKACENRAKFEMNMAAANGTTISLTVPQLHTELTGATINRQIHFTAEEQNINDWFLVKSVNLSVAATKSETKMQLITLPTQETTV